MTFPKVINYIVPMKNLIISCLLFASAFAFSQNHSNPMQTVERFFTAFHAKDSLGMQELFHPEARLMRSGQRQGKPMLTQNNIEKFIRSVALRADTPTWKEELGQPTVQQHQNLASIWVPFRFYLNDQLSHCGINHFSLVWMGKQWQIISLIDSGTKECTE